MAEYFTIMAKFKLFLIKHLLFIFSKIFNLSYLQSDVLHYLFVIVGFLTIGKIFLAELKESINVMRNVGIGGFHGSQIGCQSRLFSNLVEL
jgi:hypothetical protein